MIPRFTGPDVTVIRSFQTGLETTICRARVIFKLPLYSQIILRIYAVTNRLGGGAQNDFDPGRAKPWVRHRKRSQTFQMMSTEIQSTTTYTPSTLKYKRWKSFRCVDVRHWIMVQLTNVTLSKLVQAKRIEKHEYKDIESNNSHLKPQNLFFRPASTMVK